MQNCFSYEGLVSTVHYTTHLCSISVCSGQFLDSHQTQLNLGEKQVTGLQSTPTSPQPDLIPGEGREGGAVHPRQQPLGLHLDLQHNHPHLETPAPQHLSVRQPHQVAGVVHPVWLLGVRGGDHLGGGTETPDLGILEVGS